MIIHFLHCRLSKAKQKIEETGRQEGVYLIRQNPEDHYSYCLTVRIHANQELKNFKINCYEGMSITHLHFISFQSILVNHKYIKNTCMLKFRPHFKCTLGQFGDQVASELFHAAVLYMPGLIVCVCALFSNEFTCYVIFFLQ